jgi:hypothetical protein
MSSAKLSGDRSAVIYFDAILYRERAIQQAGDRSKDFWYSKINELER